VKLRILFWNVGGRNRRGANAPLELVPDLVREHEPHVLTLIEAPPEAEARLARSGLSLMPPKHHLRNDNPRRLLTFRLDDRITLTERAGDRYHRAHQVELPGHRSLTVAAVHLRSPNYDKGDPGRPRKRAEQCRAFIEEVERDAQHRRTVVYGDFNMDPFSPAMVDIDGLNSVSTALRARGSRTSEGTTRPTFYNPMWSLLGDRPPPAGTLYVDDDGPTGYFWHVPDQVLIRAELTGHLDEIVLIGKAGSTPLVSERAQTPCVSDHLPVVFALNESVWMR
jgi:endonuclease/exonuclease/phosphatase family metal-dependent hydrolase